MLNLQTTLIAFAIGLAVGAVPAWKLTANYKDNAYNAAIAVSKIEAAKQLQAATERAIAVERAHAKLVDNVEANHATAKQRLDKALADNRRLARELGGLRDPGPGPGSDGPVSTGLESPAQPADPSTGGGLSIPRPVLLSSAASEFILQFARDADEAAEYARACYAWIKGLSHEETGSAK